MPKTGIRARSLINQAAVIQRKPLEMGLRQTERRGFCFPFKAKQLRQDFIPPSNSGGGSPKWFSAPPEKRFEFPPTTKKGIMKAPAKRPGAPAKKEKPKQAPIHSEASFTLRSSLVSLGTRTQAERARDLVSVSGTRPYKDEIQRPVEPPRRIAL